MTAGTSTLLVMDGGNKELAMNHTGWKLSRKVSAKGYIEVMFGMHEWHLHSEVLLWSNLSKIATIDTFIQLMMSLMCQFS